MSLVLTVLLVVMFFVATGTATKNEQQKRLSVMSHLNITRTGEVSRHFNPLLDPNRDIHCTSCFLQKCRSKAPPQKKNPRLKPTDLVAFVRHCRCVSPKFSNSGAVCSFKDVTSGETCGEPEVIGLLHLLNTIGPN